MRKTSFALLSIVAFCGATALADEPRVPARTVSRSGIRVSDATMKRMRKLLPDDQVVELIGTIAGYNMVSRFVVATGVGLE